MRLRAVVLAACAALAVAATASARDIRAGGKVVSVATTATEVAFAVEVRPRCFELRVWDIADGGVRRYANRCFAATSTGSGYSTAVVSQRRALWLTYAGGNIREWALWTKTRTSAAKRLAFVARDVDAAAPIVVGSAWEGSLPYAVDDTIVVLRPDGSRRFSLKAPARVTALSAHTRGYAAVLANGNVLTLALDGRVLREHAFSEPVQAAVLVAQGLVAATRSGLEIRKGDAVRTIPLPANARFYGFAEGIVAYGTGRQLRLLRLSDGRDRLFRTLATGFRAELGRRGLGYASGPQVSFVAWSTVTSALRA